MACSMTLYDQDDLDIFLALEYYCQLSKLRMNWNVV